VKIIAGKETIVQEIPHILSDESRFTLGTPDKVFYPETVDDIRAIVKLAATESRKITLIGGQTGITGGAVPTEDCYAVCFSAMNRILRVENSRTKRPILFCQPGVTLDQIAAFAAHPDSPDCSVRNADVIRGQKLFYPPDPTEMSAQLGGTVATNASGARSFRFGPTRFHIETLSLVLANGETVTATRSPDTIPCGSLDFVTDQSTSVSVPRMQCKTPAIKNASGYFSSPDMGLIDLFIGSEGTLAIFSEIGIRLQPMPLFIGGLSFFPSAEDSFRFADFLRTQNAIAAIEFFDKTALDLVTAGKEGISLTIPGFPDGSGSAVYWEFMESDDAPFAESFDIWDVQLNRCNSSLDDTWTGLDGNKQKILKDFRHAVPDLVNAQIAECKRDCSAIRKVGTDAAVPCGQFDTLFDQFKTIILKNNLQPVIFGHLGDCHLHFNIIPHTQKELAKALAVYDELMALVITHGGTVSAEHGIGKIKVDYLEKMFGRSSIEEMKSIKFALDPHNLLNPGNLFRVQA